MYIFLHGDNVFNCALAVDYIYNLFRYKILMTNFIVFGKNKRLHKKSEEYEKKSEEHYKTFQ